MTASPGRGGTKKTPDPLRIVIAGGGTGGHFVSRYRRRAGARLASAGCAGLVCGHGARHRSAGRPREGFALDLIRSRGLKGKSIVDRARGLSLIPLGIADAWRIVSKRRPQLVIGVGGYSSGPVVLVAALRGVPTMLLEQNAVPGLTNRLLAPLVRAAAVGVRIDAGVFRIEGVRQR